MVPIAMESLEITCKKLAIAFRDSCEFYAHSETGATLIGSKNRRPDHLGDSADCRVIGWPDGQPEVPLQRRRFRKGDERTNWTHIFNLTLNLGLRGKYSNGPSDQRSRVSTSFSNGRHLRWSPHSVISKAQLRPPRLQNEPLHRRRGSWFIEAITKSWSRSKGVGRPHHLRVHNRPQKCGKDER